MWESVRVERPASFVYNLNGSDLSDSSFVFAYQAEAGLRYKLGQNASEALRMIFWAQRIPAGTSAKPSV